MPRKPIQRTDKFPYHITARVNNKKHFPLELNLVWEIMLKQLWFIRREEEVNIHCFVLMPNHWHLIIDTPKANIDKVMYWFMKKTTLKMQKQSGMINKIYGGRYKASLIKDDHYYLNAYKYVAQNPVRAKLCGLVQDYPFSTFYKRVHLPFRLKTLNDEYCKNLKWLNQSFTEKENWSMKVGLLRKEFKYGVDKSTRLKIRPKLN